MLRWFPRVIRHLIQINDVMLKRFNVAHNHGAAQKMCLRIIHSSVHRLERSRAAFSSAPARLPSSALYWRARSDCRASVRRCWQRCLSIDIHHHDEPLWRPHVLRITTSPPTRAPPHHIVAINATNPSSFVTNLLLSLRRQSIPVTFQLSSSNAVFCFIYNSYSS